MRYAINRLLKKSGRKFDITKSDEFIPCQMAFDDAIKELKVLGYGYVVNHVEILPEGNFFGINFTASSLCLNVMT